MPIYTVVLEPTPTQHKIQMEIDSSATHPLDLSEHLIYLSEIIFHKCLDVSPYFSTTGYTDYPCLLTAGILMTSGTASIGNYVIEWHVNSITGNTTLISGVGSDPDIMQINPFANVPVESGNLFPVIRYIVLDGIKYWSTSGHTTGQYSPDLVDCLDPIYVLPMTCYNGNNPAPGGTTDSIGSGYTHQLHYYYTQTNLIQSGRTINFVLNTGGTTKFLAWYFNTSTTISDSIKITYMNSASTSMGVLNYWVVGGNVPSTNTGTTPGRYKDSIFGADYYLQAITNLSGITYNNGDYLKIEILPGMTLNNNTNWDLYLKCMNSFDCTNFPNGYNILNSNPSTYGMTGSTTGGMCFYDFKFRTMSGYTITDFFKYLSIPSFNNNYTNPTANVITTQRFYLYTSYNPSNTTFVQTCTLQNGTTSIIKNGTGVTLTFTNLTDYNYYKNSYYTVIGNANISGNYTSDPTNINHYKNIVLYIRSATTCGDVFTDYPISFDYTGSTVTFEDIYKRITIGMVANTNGVTEVTCDSKHSSIDEMINQVNLASNLNWPSTNVRITNPFYGRYITGPYYYNDTEIEYSKFYNIYPIFFSGVCNLSSYSNWFFITGNTGVSTNPSNLNSYTGQYVYFKYRVKVTITKTTDPENNWKFYNGLNSNGWPTDYVLFAERATPTVTTTTATSITQTGATSGGNVTLSGTSSVTARGVCWKTTANPTIADNKTTNGSGLGSFTSAITGLTTGTLYHYRAYATSAIGTDYGVDLTFTTI